MATVWLPNLRNDNGNEVDKIYNEFKKNEKKMEEIRKKSTNFLNYVENLKEDVKKKRSSYTRNIKRFRI